MVLAQPQQSLIASLQTHFTLTREMPSDLDTPVSVYLKLAQSGSPSFLLESVTGGEQVGRYSFIGVDPKVALVIRGRTIEKFESGVKTIIEVDDPLTAIQNELNGYAVEHNPSLPRFIGGMVGYLGYETIQFFEPRLNLPKSDLPDGIFLLADTIIAFDHARGRTLLMTTVTPTARAEAEAKLESLATKISSPQIPKPTNSLPINKREMRSNFTQKQFESMVEKAKEHIAAGDIFQVVLSQKLSLQTSASPFDVYRSLRRLNPSPYMFFFDFGDLINEPLHLIGASPEILTRLEGRTATVRPIAGTRKRGVTHEEDRANEIDLLKDPKERAEHVMLVDLGRNDLGRVSKYGTVKVSELMTVERYSHVMHIVSHVESELRDERDAYDLIRATFPAGTVSGAPKVRAMEIIADLEKGSRGVYAGLVGYIGFDGSMDTCIAIRTMTMCGDVVTVQTGAGIVADSIPANEYEETMNKAKAVIKAVEAAENL